MSQFNRIEVTEEMLENRVLNNLYNLPWSKKPEGIYIEYFDGTGDAWYTHEDSENSPIITCPNCRGEFVNNSSYAADPDICPHCQNVVNGYGHNHSTDSTSFMANDEKMVYASCGHSIPATQLMDTSSGSSCPDCYDRMSN